MKRFLAVLVLPLLALAQTPEPTSQIESTLARSTFWKGTETIPQYARRLNLPERQTITLPNPVDPTGRGVPLTFTLIPAGEFLMGSPASEPERLPAETLHKVQLTHPFMLLTTPVTQAQWDALLGEKSNPSRFHGDDLPVASVTWTDAVKFCTALSAREDKTFHLPTEAQWEFACRAGTTTPFWFGNAISPARANYNGNILYSGGGGGSDYRVTTTPVDTFKPNPWGLYDMHGNVWQWCSDWLGEIPAADATDPLGPDYGTARVLRGGSWADTPRFLRSACRESTPPDQSRIHIGFRVVLEVPQ